MGGTDELRRILKESHDPRNPTPEELREIIGSVRTIAVVGISRNPEKAARRVPSYMAGKGYEIIPVNPFVDQVLGKTAKGSLEEVDEPVDMVLVFRPSEEAAAILTAASARPEKPVIWLQEGIQADSEAARARSEGLRVIQDLCIYKVHRALD